MTWSEWSGAGAIKTVVVVVPINKTSFDIPRNWMKRQQASSRGR